MVQKNRTQQSNRTGLSAEDTFIPMNDILKVIPPQRHAKPPNSELNKIKTGFLLIILQLTTLQKTF